MSYHIEYIPQTHDRTKHSKGNGGKTGCSAGHKLKSLDNEGSFLYGDGCLKHDIAHCADCTRPDCDWDYMVEYELRKKLNEKNKNE
ncbi:MAG: hypothetical protein PHQ86_04710 [Dehalococcoidales bacterium]|nr:hypothetical protein [Dehalococcoidales bacterium]